MFLGRYPASIDAKGRLVLPSQYREVLKAKEEDTLLVTNHQDPFLWAYPLEDWKARGKNIEDPSSYDEKQADYIMYFFSLVNECSLDGQGRILVPTLLRQHAQLEKEAVLIGMGIKIAIWAKERWDQFEAEMVKKKAELSKHMHGFGF